MIEFDSPQRMALKEITTTRYQKKDRFQNLHIDLLNGDGKPQNMPRKTRVSYVIRLE